MLGLSQERLEREALLRGALNGLRALTGLTGRRFHRGFVLYTGSASVSFASNLHAVPISALWETQAVD